MVSTPLGNGAEPTTPLPAHNPSLDHSLGSTTPLDSTPTPVLDSNSVAVQVFDSRSKGKTVSRDLSFTSYREPRSASKDIPRFLQDVSSFSFGIAASGDRKRKRKTPMIPPTPKTTDPGTTSATRYRPWSQRNDGFEIVPKQRRLDIGDDGPSLRSTPTPSAVSGLSS